MSDATSQKQDQILENQEASCGPWARGGRRSVTSTRRPPERMPRARHQEAAACLDQEANASGGLPRRPRDRAPVAPCIWNSSPRSSGVSRSTVASWIQPFGRDTEAAARSFGMSKYIPLG
jgi:hypothetical protein